jgi:hypothetical protein
MVLGHGALHSPLRGGQTGKSDPARFYNSRHPDIAARLQRFAEAHIKKFYSETKK